MCVCLNIHLFISIIIYLIHVFIFYIMTGSFDHPFFCANKADFTTNSLSLQNDFSVPLHHRTAPCDNNHLRVKSSPKSNKHGRNRGIGVALTSCKQSAQYGVIYTRRASYGAILRRLRDGLSNGDRNLSRRRSGEGRGGGTAPRFITSPFHQITMKNYVTFFISI